MVKAIIFDFDGVLVESVDVKTKAFANMFEKYGPDVVQKVVEHHLANGGMSRFEKIAYYHSEILKKPLSKTELNTLCEQFSDMVVEHVINAPMVEGAEVFLSNNYTRYLLFIVSGTPQDELRSIVRRRKMDYFFKGIFGSPADKVSLTRSVLDTFSLDRKQVFFVGDAITDYRAAHKTGIRFIGRVSPGLTNIFPGDTRVIPDLTGLEHGIQILE